MTLQERIQLLNSGYTKDEIESMSNETVENSTVDNSTNVEYSVDEEDESENTESKSENTETSSVNEMRTEFNNFMKSMQQEMAEQIKALQKFNLQHDKIQTIQKESAEDVLAKIINPPQKESEEK